MMKHKSLNDEPCMVRPTLIDLNLVVLKYYSFTISLGKYKGNCNSGNDLCRKISVSIKIKYSNVKAFNIITRTNETKTLVNIFHVIVNTNSIEQHVTQITNEIIIHVNVNVKIIVSVKKIIVVILAHTLVRIASI